MARANVNPVIMGTNSPYANGINDSCGGCVSPQVCVGTTCVTPTDYSTDSSACGASQTACGSNQTCISGSCVSTTTDGASCYPNNTACSNGGSCMAGLCLCSGGFIGDSHDCGACGNACSQGQMCSYGNCIDNNLCSDGGCAGTACAGMSIGGTCTDGYEYAGGNLEMTSTDLTGQTWAQATAYCASLGAGWSLPTEGQLNALYVNYYANNTNLGMSKASNYWSSSQNASYVWIQYFGGGGTETYSMQSDPAGQCSVRCVHDL